MCLVRYPQISMGSMAATFGYNPSLPCLCSWSGNLVFLNFHSKSLVPTLAVGDLHPPLWLHKYLLRIITLNDANHWYSTSVVNKVDQSDYRKITIHLRKLVVQYNYYEMKWTTWIKISQLQPRDMTFWSCWRKLVFPEMSLAVCEWRQKT